jgi:cyclase
MLKHRVIPVLLLKDGGLVKTERFRKPKYVGDPINAVRIFNDKEVDELIVLDINASRLGKEPDYALIEDFASECFMPLTYGGGVHSLGQAERLFSLGVEKISLQTSVLRDLSIISRFASRFGTQAIAVSIDVKRDLFGRPRLFSSANGKFVPQAWQELAQQAQDAGAGEVLLNSVDRDGTLSGPDVELIREGAANLTIPLVAMGGIASLADMRTVVNAGASAVAAGAFFVFNGPHRAVLITYPGYDELEALFA